MTIESEEVDSSDQTPNITRLLRLMDHRAGILLEQVPSHLQYMVPFSVLWPMLAKAVSKMDLSDEDRRFIWTNTDRLTTIPPYLTNYEAVELLREIMAACLKAEDGRQQG